jgi:uncharacterized protein YhhL (DUF1145 family)
MYESGYSRLFLGMMFIIFNINIGAINLLPNFIGFMLIFSGLGILAVQNKFYEKGRIPAVILIIMTLKDIINYGNVNLLDKAFEMKNLLLSALGVVELLITIYLIYIICKGINLLSDERGLIELRDSARVRFNFYFVISVVLLFFTPFSINLSKSVNLFMALVAIINLIALLFIAGLIKKSKIQLGEGVDSET